MEAVDKIVETAPSEVVRVATVDGKVVEVPCKVSLFQKMGKEVVKDVGSQAVKETGALKSAPEKFHSTTASKTQIFEKNAKHIFRDAPGHLLDTPANRELLQNVASDPSNFLCTDQHGTQWFAKTIKDSKQVWAGVRENSIRYGGMNETPKIPDSKTGLSRLLPKAKK